MIKSKSFLRCFFFVETDSTHILIFQELLKPFGHDITEQFYKEKITGRLNPEIFRELLPPTYTEQEIVDFGTNKERIFRERAEEGNLLSPLRGLLPLLEDIKESKIKCGCVTNAPRENADFLLQALKVRHYFDFVVLGDDCEAGKPHPAPYLKGLEVAGVPASECITFEDSPSGVKSSVAAGIKTIGVTSTQPPSVLLQCGASTTIPDFADVNVNFLRNLIKK